MQGIVDRIEDGRIAVIRIRGGGELVIPVSKLPVKIHEGAVLDICMELNPAAEKKQRQKIKDLQKDLLKKNAPK
jgi:hypothetical protein